VSLRTVFVSVAVLTCSLAPAAAGVGPSLGTVEGLGGVLAANGEVRYVTALGAGSTTLSALDADGRSLRSARISGSWGIPRVTLNGATGGLSADGHMLVLGDNTTPGGSLRPRSGFAVVDTRTLTAKDVIHLRGDFSFDALSPQGAILYLIQHASSSDVTSYRVRAYDLRARRLLPGAIADKRQSNWDMNGYPVARATSTNGRWIYTLYQQGGNYPFVHALDTMNRTAVCIGLPWQWASSGQAIASATLRLAGGKLLIAGGRGSSTRFELDTRTFHVSASGEHTTT
jgi:hypothetical protein